MRPQKQLSQESLERALKVLHAVAKLWSPEEDNEVPSRDSSHEEYLTVRQAAERIQYREQTVRNMMSTGIFKRGLHYYKRRGRVLFVWSRIEQWLQEDSSALSGEISVGSDSDLPDANEPFYPVHRARTRKKRQALL
jgi:hypothetical protein